MAKTKLLAKVEDSLKQMGDAARAIAQNILAHEEVSDADSKLLHQKWLIAQRAMDEMQTHLDNLQRRENNPTVTDRIRNLKNVFKDKAELKRKRQATTDTFDQLRKDTEGEVETAEMFLNQIIEFNRKVRAHKAEAVGH